MAVAKPALVTSSTQISNPIKALLFVFVLLTIAGGFYLVIYSDLVDKLASAQQTEVRLHDDLAKAREIEADYQRDLAELTDKQQKQRDLNKTLPESAETPAFLSAIQSVATSTGIALNSWEPMSEVPQQFYTKVPMKLKISGRFHQVAKFFYGISQLDRIINIENITIAPVKASGDQGQEEVQVNTECLATAFHTGTRGGQAKPGAPGAPAPAASGGK